MQCLFWFIICDSWLALLEKCQDPCYWIFYVFTFQMLCLFLISPQKLCIPPLLLFQWGCMPPHTQSWHLALAFSYTGALSFHGTKGQFSHWCPRPSSATYNARATLNVVKVLCGHFHTWGCSLNETLSFHNEIVSFYINLQSTIWTPFNFS